MRLAWRSLLVPAAEAAVRRMLAAGLPPALAVPLRYLAWPVVAAADQAPIAAIEQLRAALSQSTSASPLIYASPQPRVFDFARYAWHWRPDA
jgi:hypothetical protein